MGGVAASAVSGDAPPPVEADGTVHVPAFDIPLSSYMSPQARAKFIEQARHPPFAAGAGKDVNGMRQVIDDYARPLVAHSRQLYPVDEREQIIAGVATNVIMPRAGVASRNCGRVLVNLHGGAFSVGAGLAALLECIPMAAVGRIKVISVDYRQGPENHFPAATLDVAAVYRELLRDHAPRTIGIYGCSAGGILSAMAVAWFQREKLPAPGAIAIIGAGAFADFNGPLSTAGSWGGDSVFTGPALRGTRPLLVTGTRAFDMSVAVQTQRVLTKAGVDAELHVWDGMGHCFLKDPDLPESQEAFSVVTNFFDARLGRQAACH
jgi:monoterpene epsilon-lactone hydrolase